MRQNVTTGVIPLRKAWLQAIVDRVEVSADIIRIIGDPGGRHRRRGLLNRDRCSQFCTGMARPTGGDVIVYGYR